MDAERRREAADLEARAASGRVEATGTDGVLAADDAAAIAGTGPPLGAAEVAAPHVVSSERPDYATLLPQRTKLTILGSVILCLFLAALDSTIVATALPAIVSQFHAIDLLAWVSIGYLLSSTAMVPIYGRLSDQIGRRAVLVFGLAVFLLGSALCGFAPGMISLIVFRVVQGVGAAGIMSTAFAVPADLYPPAERSRYMGFFGASFGLASVIGPWIGGLITEHLDWRWIFFVNLPLGAIAAAFILSRMPRLGGGVRHPLDLRGTAFLLIAVVSLLLGLSLDPSRQVRGVPLDPLLIAVAVVSALLYVHAERRAAAPILPLAFFRNRTFATVTAASFLFGAAFIAAVLFLSLFMVNVVGVTAAEAGTAIMPLTLGVVAGGLAASAVVHRTHRYKSLIVAGLVVMIVGFWLASTMNETVTSAGVMWRMVVLGLGAGPGMPLLNLALQNAVPMEQVGTATGGRQFFTLIGQSIGAAVLGAVLAISLTREIDRRVEPLFADLPPAARAVVDGSRLRQSQSGRGGADLWSGIDRDLQAALRRDYEARRAAAPASERAAIAASEATALQDVHARTTRAALELRRAFAVAVTRTFFGGLLVSIAALIVIALGLPELRLRTSNRPEEFETLGV